MTTIQIGNKWTGTRPQRLVSGQALVPATLQLDPYWLWYLQVAHEDTDIRVGLTGVPSLPSANGMLFDMGVEGIISVDCAGIVFPVGIVFFDNDLVVVETQGASYLSEEGIQPGDVAISTSLARFALLCNPNEVVGVTPGLVGVLTGYEPPVPPVPEPEPEPRQPTDVVGDMLGQVVPAIMLMMILPMMAEVGT